MLNESTNVVDAMIRVLDDISDDSIDERVAMISDAYHTRRSTVYSHIHVTVYVRASRNTMALLNHIDNAIKSKPTPERDFIPPNIFPEPSWLLTLPLADEKHPNRAYEALITKSINDWHKFLYMLSTRYHNRTDEFTRITDALIDAFDQHFDHFIDTPLGIPKSKTRTGNMFRVTMRFVPYKAGRFKIYTTCLGWDHLTDSSAYTEISDTIEISVTVTGSKKHSTVSEIIPEARKRIVSMLNEHHRPDLVEYVIGG